MKIGNVVSFGIKMAGLAITAGAIAGSIISPRMRGNAFLILEEEPPPAQPGPAKQALTTARDTLLLFGPVRRLFGMDRDWPE